LTSYLFANEVIEKEEFQLSQSKKSINIPEIAVENEYEENQTISTRTR